MAIVSIKKIEYHNEGTEVTFHCLDKPSGFDMHLSVSLPSPLQADSIVDEVYLARRKLLRQLESIVAELHKQP